MTSIPLPAFTVILVKFHTRPALPLVELKSSVNDAHGSNVSGAAILIIGLIAFNGLAMIVLILVAVFQVKQSSIDKSHCDLNNPDFNETWVPILIKLLPLSLLLYKTCTVLFDNQIQSCDDSWPSLNSNKFIQENGAINHNQLYQ